MKIIRKSYSTVVLMLMALTSCNSSNSSNSAPGAIELSLKWKETAERSASVERSAIDCNGMGIDSLTAAVLSASGEESRAEGGPWRCDSNEGHIDDISPEQDLIVELRALDADGKVKYYGRTSGVEIRPGSVTPVSVVLDAVTPTPFVSLFRDIYEGTRGSYPHQLELLGDRIFFVARQPDIDFELFVTDGSNDSTQLVKDIYPHPMVAPSVQQIREPRDLTEYNGLFYFLADDGISGLGIWQTDGSTENTHLIDGFESTGIVDPSHLMTFNNKLYFSAEHSEFGRELWASDGTAAGTHMVHDIFVGARSGNPYEFAVMGNWLYFVANDDTHGYEIWRTNGTTTALVDDIARTAVPGSPDKTQDSYALDLTVVNGRLFFRATDQGQFGEEIWMITGNDNFVRTDLVSNLNAIDNRSSRPRSLAAINDTFLVFSATQVNAGESASLSGNELWLYDWRDNRGPIRISDINSGSPDSNPDNFVSAGDVLYFTANNSRGEKHLWAWTLDTLTAPVSLTMEMIDPDPRCLTVFEGLVYFTAYDASFGRELWYTNGTTTERVEDLCPGACSSSPSNFAVLDNRLFFSAYVPGEGNEMFRLYHDYEP